MIEGTRLLLARTDLTSSAKVVMLVLVDLADAEGRIEASLTALVQATGLADKTLRRTLADLTVAGMIEIVSKPGVPSVIQLKGPVIPTDPDPGTPVILPDRMTGVQDISTGPLAHAREEGTSSSNSDQRITSTVAEKRGGAGGERTRRTPTLLPEEWQPNLRTLGICANEHRDVDMSRELVFFRRYWQEGKGAGTRRADWDGTFLNWMARARPIAAAPAGARAASPSGPVPSGGMAHLFGIIEGARKRHG